MGDDEFKDLYVRLGAQIFAFAALRLSPEQAKDVVNSTFEVVWNKRLAVPSDPAQWPAWIFGIAKNQVRQEAQRVRRKHHDNRFLDEFSTQMDAPKSPDIADAVAISDRGRRIWSQLTPAERNLLNIAFMRDLAKEEGATLLGITLTAYTTRVTRLRQRIASLDMADEEVASGAESGGH